MKEHPDDDLIVSAAEGKVTRRSFLVGAGLAGVTAAAPLCLGEATSAEPSRQASTTAHTLVSLKLKVNGTMRELLIDTRATLLDALRESASLTGTKKGCDHGQCGACTVHVNGRRINSCLTLAVMHAADEITTIEGLGDVDRLHPLQAAFMTHDAFQCGYCTSGQIMSAAALLHEPCGEADADVKDLMSGNICRCGAYANIVRAVQSVRSRAGGGSNANV